MLRFWTVRSDSRSSTSPAPEGCSRTQPASPNGAVPALPNLCVSRSVLLFSYIVLRNPLHQIHKPTGMPEQHPLTFLDDPFVHQICEPEHCFTCVGRVQWQPFTA